MDGRWLLQTRLRLLALAEPIELGKGLQHGFMRRCEVDIMVAGAIGGEAGGARSRWDGVRRLGILQYHG